MHIEVRVPGSCGELVQGVIAGRPFLVTCPVNLYTTAYVTDGPPPGGPLEPKAQQALLRTLSFFDAADFPYAVSLRSELPSGKGMASSSADIAAVCFAVAAALGRRLTVGQAAQLAAGIEPTDGVFFPGIVQMNHMTGECLASFGEPPPLQLLIFDTGGLVDTLQFHQREDLIELARQNEAQVRQAMQLLTRPLQAEAVSRAAFLSAAANQSIIEKKELFSIMDMAGQFGALGMNTAHSGTVLGVIFPADAPAALLDACEARVLGQYAHLTSLGRVRLISGGYSIKAGAAND